MEKIRRYEERQGEFDDSRVVEIGDKQRKHAHADIKEKVVFQKLFADDDKQTAPPKRPQKPRTTPKPRQNRLKNPNKTECMRGYARQNFNNFDD